MSSPPGAGRRPRRRILAVPLAVLALPLFVACGRGTDGSPVTVRDSMGVEVVESRRPTWEDGAGWTVADSPTAEIGAGREPGQQLHRVAGIAVLDDGRIVVANGGDRTLRFYSPEGEFLFRAGGEGEGPGELSGTGGLARFGPDTLATLDPGDGALELYGSDGSHLGRIRLEATGDPVRPHRMYEVGGAFGDGGLLLLPNAYPANMRREPTVYWDSVPNLVYARDGTLRDTVGRPSGMEIYATPKRAGSVPYGMVTRADVASGHLYQGRGEDFTVRVYGPGGLERVVRRADARRRPVPDSLRSELRESTGKPVPDRRPAYSGIAVDPAGNLWVEHHLAVRESGPATWSVFGSDGAWLGDVRVPVNLNHVRVTADALVGVWRDAAGVERVRVYPVARSR